MVIYFIKVNYEKIAYKYLIVNKANHLVAYVNDKKTFEHQLSSDIGEIGGVDLAFEGVGEIGRVVFTNSNEKVVLQE